MAKQIMEDIADILIDEESFMKLIDKFQIKNLDKMAKYIAKMTNKIKELEKQQMEEMFFKGKEITEFGQFEVGKCILCKFDASTRQFGILRIVNINQEKKTIAVNLLHKEFYRDWPIYDNLRDGCDSYNCCGSNLIFKEVNGKWILDEISGKFKDFINIFRFEQKFEYLGGPI